ncbi:MAG: hypothetical protein AW11_01349 [Candidatus Accumulibacter regalis]|uniref:Uncharacterized protein n=1 Tax=Accumulibacter regalis TaxID=522306 RepID=A0A011PQE1_ACCRE|nr:MAG: hypothetical protein AW11_01349 [Candidatus Accumulibacter regalis]
MVRSTAGADGGAMADGSANQGATTVGAAVAINAMDVSNRAEVGAATVKAVGLTVEAMLPPVAAGSPVEHVMSATAISGASNADIGVAGAFALNAPGDQLSIATLKSGAVVDAGNGSVTLSAENRTQSTTTAEAAQSGGNTLGIGASLALDFEHRRTEASIGDDVALTQAGAVTLTAVSDHRVTTEARAGAGGATALGGAVALSVVNHETVAAIGEAGSQELLTVGSLDALASQRSESSTVADGTVHGTGRAAVGAALGLNIVDQTTTATTGRDLSATAGGVSLRAEAYSGTNAGATASATGADPSASHALGQDSTEDQVTTQLSGRDPNASKHANAIGGKAKTSDGSVSIAAGLALNLITSHVDATMPAGLTIAADIGPVRLIASNETDAAAVADGSAVDGSNRVGVGAAVALNVVAAHNEAVVGLGGHVTAQGVILEAVMSDLSMGGDGHSTYSAQAISGAGATNVGVAGAFALNSVKTGTEAVVHASQVDAGAGDILVRASNKESDNATATASVSSSGRVGVGASVALNLLEEHVTTAEIEDNAVLSGSGGLLLSATSARSVDTEVQAGSTGGIAVSPAVAIAIVDNATTARLGAGGALSTLSRDVSITAEHTGSVASHGDAIAAGDRAAVGAIVAVNAVADNATAALLRDVATTGGTVVVMTRTGHSSSALVKASTKGALSTGRKADSEASTQAGRDLPTAQGSIDGANSDANAQSGNGASGIGVAAAVAVNWVRATSTAAIGDAVRVSAADGVRVEVANEADATTKATGTSLSNDASANIGAAVGLNIATVQNTASVGHHAQVLTADGGITVSAITPAQETNDFVVWGSAAASGAKSDASVAGSVGVNVVALTSRASVGNDAQLKAEGSSGAIRLTASSPMMLQNLAVASALSGGGTAVGAAVAVNVIEHSTEATIGLDTELDASGTVTLTATSSLLPLQDADSPILDDGATVGSLAIGGGASTGVVGIGGSVIVNVLRLNTHAGIGRGALINQDPNLVAGDDQSVRLAATDATVLGNAAGARSLSAGGTGIGLGLIVDVIHKDVSAYIDSSSNVPSKVSAAQDIAIEASSREQIRGLAASAGVADSAGVSGSVIVVVLSGKTGAYLGDNVLLYAGGNVVISASDDAVNSDDPSRPGIELYAGASAFGGTAGVGISSSTLVKTSIVAAYIGDDAEVEVAGSQGLSVTATQTECLNTVAQGGSGGGDAGVAGSATVNVLDHTTLAYLGKGTGSGTNVDATGVVLSAADRTTIQGVAGSLAVGGAAGVGAGVDVAVVTKKTEAWIGEGAVVRSANNVNVTSASNEEINSLSASETLSGTAAIALNAGVSVLSITTRAFMTSDAVVSAYGNVDVSATELTDLDIRSGNYSESGTASIGAAAAVPVINKTTEAYIGQSAQVVALGQGSDNDLTIQVGDHTISMRGLSVVASNRDTVSGIGVSGGVAGSVSVNVGGSVSVMTISTLAHIDQGARINTQNSLGAADSQSVVVAAFNDFVQAGIAGAVSISGSVSVAPGADVRVVNLTTKAYIGSVVEVQVKGDVRVLADAREDITSIAAGLAGSGTVSVGGAVGVTVVNNHTWAYIDDAARVFAAGNVQVFATDTTEVKSYIGSLGFGIGAAGLGASVSVVTVTKDTRAYLGQNAIVDALGTSSHTIDGICTDESTIDGSVTRADGVRGVAIQAVSTEEVTGAAAAGGGGFYAGLAGGVTVEIIRSGTSAFIGPNAWVNTEAGASASQSVHVSAFNDAKLDARAGGLGVGVAGIGGAVDVGVLRNDVSAYIGSGSIVNAMAEVNVSALSSKDVDSVVLSVAGGLVGAAGSVSVWSIGAGSGSTYSDGNGKAGDAMPTGDNSQSLHGFADRQASGSDSQNGWQQIVSGYQGDGNANSSRSRVAAATDGASTRLASSAPSGQISTGINTVPQTPPGTAAYIGGEVNAGGSVGVVARDYVEFKAVVGNAAIGAVALGASVAVANIADRTEAFISGGATVNAGAGPSSDITVSAAMGEHATGNAYAGQAGAVSLGAQVVVIRDRSMVSAHMDGRIDQAAAVRILADTNRIVTSNALGVSFGAISAGAAIAVAEGGGSTSAYIGSGAQVGEQSANGQFVQDIDITAQSIDTADARTVGVSAGIGIALGGSVALATVNPNVSARIEPGATAIMAWDAINVSAAATPQANANALGVNAGAFAIGVSMAEAESTPVVSASVGGSIGAATLSVNAAQATPANGLAAKSYATGAVGGLIGVNATFSTAKNAGTVTGYVADNSILTVIDAISINATANSGQQADADSATIGLVAIGGNLVRAESNVITSAYLGTGVLIGTGGSIGGLQDGQTYYLALDDTRGFTPTDDIEGDEIRLGAGLVTGDQVVYQEGFLANPAITGLTDGAVYSVRVNADDPTEASLVDSNGQDINLDASGAMGSGYSFYLLDLDETRVFTPTADIADNKIKLGAGLITGDKVVYQQGFVANNPGIMGLTNGAVYSVKVNANDPNKVGLVDSDGQDVENLDASGAIGFSYRFNLLDPRRIRLASSHDDATNEQEDPNGRPIRAPVTLPIARALARGSAQTLTSQSNPSQVLHFDAWSDINGLEQAINVDPGEAFYTGQAVVYHQGKGPSLTLSASGDDYDFARARAGAGGLVAGAAASATVESDSATRAYIGEFAQVEVSSLTVRASHTARFDSQTNTLQAALVGFSGSWATNRVTSTVDAAIGNDASVTTQNLVIDAQNVSRKNLLGSDDYNIRAGSGGVWQGNAAESNTDIVNRTHSTIGDHAQVNVTGNISAPGALILNAFNDVEGYDKVKLDTGGVIVGSGATSAIRANTNDARVKIGDGAIVTTVGEANLQTRTRSHLEVAPQVHTYGLASAARVDGLASVHNDNQVVIGTGAILVAQGDIKLLAGQQSDGTRNQLYVRSQGDELNASVLPIDHLQSHGEIVQNHNITIAAGARVATARDVTLNAERYGAAIAYGYGKGKNWMTALTSGIDKLLGGNIPEEMKGGTTTNELNAKVTVNGTIEAGIAKDKTLIVPKDYLLTHEGLVNVGEITLRETDESVATNLVNELNHWRELKAQYSGQPILEAAYQNEIDRVEQALVELELQATDLDGNFIPHTYVEALVSPFITVDDIWAQSGTIYVYGNDLSGSDTGVLNANSGVHVTIQNDSPANLRISKITIPDEAGGRVRFNSMDVGSANDVRNINQDSAVTPAFAIRSAPELPSLDPGNDPNAPQISIISTYDADDETNQSDSYYGLFAQPSILLAGDINNIVGKVRADSLHGAVHVSANINAGAIEIHAGGEFVQSYADGLLSTGGNPGSIWQPVANITEDRARAASAQFLNTHSDPDPGRYGLLNYVYGQGNPATDLAVNSVLNNPVSGNVIAAANVYISAKYLNINGLVQSGQPQQSVHVTSAVLTQIEAARRAYELYKQTGNATAARALLNVGDWASVTDKATITNDFRYFLLSTPGNQNASGTIKAFYSAEGDRIELADVKVQGGYLQLFGEILSTGNGQLKVLDGYGQINIVNDTSKVLLTNLLDTGDGGSGKVKITDTSFLDAGGNPMVTEYTRLHGDVQKKVYFSPENPDSVANVRVAAGRTATYTPRDGYRYYWQSGLEFTTVTTEVFGKSSWFGIDALAKDPSARRSSRTEQLQAVPFRLPGEYVSVSNPLDQRDYTFQADKIVTASDIIYRHSWTKKKWYGKKTYYLEQRTLTGSRDIYSHSIRADRPIGIEFIGADPGESGSGVSVISGGAILINDRIHDIAGTTVLQATAGDIQQLKSDAVIGGRSIVLRAGAALCCEPPRALELATVARVRRWP